MHGEDGPEEEGEKQGEGHGNIVRIESAPGRLSEDVLGQPQGSGQSEARRHAESVDTGGFQIQPVLDEESRHEHEFRRLDDEAAGEAED